MIQINAVDHLNMNVTNLNETITFYQDVFGFSIYEQEDYKGAPYAIIGKKDSLFLCLYEEKGFKASKHDISHIGFNIKNFDEIEEVLKKNKLSKLTSHRRKQSKFSDEQNQINLTFCE